MSHPKGKNDVSHMRHLLGRYVLYLGVFLCSSCSLLPKVDMEDGMDWGENYWGLEDGMSQSQVIHRKGRPQQVRLVTEVNRSANWWERMRCNGCEGCLRGLPCTRWRTAEVWLYRDYMWNPRREGAWRLFDMDRWGSWDLYFDADKKLRAVKMVEPAPSEPNARSVTWLKVERQRRYTHGSVSPSQIQDNKVNEMLSGLSPGRLKVLRRVTRKCEPQQILEVVNTTQGVRPLRVGEKTYFKIKHDPHMGQGEWKWGIRKGTDPELKKTEDGTAYVISRLPTNSNVRYDDVDYMQFQGAEYILADRSGENAKLGQITWTWIEVVE